MQIKVLMLNLFLGKLVFLDNDKLFCSFQMKTTQNNSSFIKMYWILNLLTCPFLSHYVTGCYWLHNALLMSPSNPAASAKFPKPPHQGRWCIKEVASWINYIFITCNAVSNPLNLTASSLMGSLTRQLNIFVHIFYFIFAAVYLFIYFFKSKVGHYTRLE